MSSDREFEILFGRIEAALWQAQKMQLSLLDHLLQMALLEATEQSGRMAPAQIPRHRLRVN